MKDGVYIVLERYEGWKIVAADEYGNQNTLQTGFLTCEEAMRAAALNFSRPFGFKLVPL